MTKLERIFINAKNTDVINKQHVACDRSICYNSIMFVDLELE